VRILEAKGGGRAMAFDSPIDKMVMSFLGFAEKLEPDKARMRTRDALQRRAERGYVAGGVLRLRQR
jgi:DNA invertase Pin-like site-specific DNA recombinase